MTLEEVRKYYGTGYKFEKVTGMLRSNFWKWKKDGFIPIRSQMKIQDLTKGELKASLSDLKWE